MELLEYERKHLEALRSSLAECTVLLKSDGSFPLTEACELALYGSGARQTVKGGTGSGEVNSRFFVNVENGLEQAGFRLTTKTWLYEYDRMREGAKKAFLNTLKKRARANRTNVVIEGMGAVMPEPEYELPLDGTGDTAVYVLARISGEGNDREPVAGDVLLTETETRDILQLAGQYRRFLLVLNVGGPVDLSPVADAVPNILLLSQLGVETGAALADILLGKANPSGKLTTTWAAWPDYPTVGEFGDLNITRYREGIYVGYRYFDSAGVTPLFPFGFGLSFTDFECTDEKTELSGEEVTVSATVKNSGSRPGKQVLQLYVSKPEERLDHPFQELVAFAKTRELQPGEEETLNISFPVSELRSYDSEQAAWILEKGDYFLRMGCSSAETKPVARLRLEEEVTVRRVKNVCGVTDFADWKPRLERIDLFSPDVPILTIDPATIATQETVYPWKPETDTAAKQLDTDGLIRMNLGAYDPKAGVASVIGDAAFSVAGAAGETCGLTRELDLKPLVMADGPAGLRLSRDYAETENGPVSAGQAIPESILDVLPAPIRWAASKMGKKLPKNAEILHQYATAIPIGTAIAQSWNLDFAEACGDLVGDEMERMNVDLWLAPALNIHRSILCGRNFEYFSEDPIVSGCFAAAITKGVQRHPGRGTTVKHFAANNQEHNRYNSNSAVSERAMREIYLRGFELCIRASAPLALMTSYNLLNGTHTSGHRGLLQDILRCEFGYQGIVMTDWVISGVNDKRSVYPRADAGRVAAAGGELFMPGCGGDYKRIREALDRGILSEGQLRENIGHLIGRIRKQREAAGKTPAAGDERE